jgi:cytidylate kinase
MAIVTISRGTFAGGEQLAATLAQRLGYRTVNRELLYRRVQSDYGFKPDELSELMEQAPSIRSAQVAERKSRVSIGERRRQLFIAVQAAACELLKDDDVVYAGLAGHLLLPGVAHVLRVRTVAPRATRTELCMEAEGLDRVAAGRKIDQVDAERARWTQSFFGVNWGDPLLFDLVLNLENLTIEDAAEIVVHAVSLERFRATAASRKKMEDLALASRVVASINADARRPAYAVDVRADGGVVRLLGMLDRHELDRISKLVAEVEGVTRVELAEQPSS